MWSVYFLRSLKRRWYYVGSTNRLEERLKEHNNLMVRSTKFYVPLILVHKFDFNTEKKLETMNKRLKNKEF